MLLLGASPTYAQTDVTDTYIQNADFASTDNWTVASSSSFHDEGNGPIGTYNVRSIDGQTSTTDDTHTADMYCLGVEARWLSNYVYFQQKVTLPMGVYTLSYDVENRNTNTKNNNYVNYFSVSDGTNSYSDESTEWMSGASTWISHSIDFALGTEGEIAINLGYGLPLTQNESLQSDNQYHHANYTPVLYISNLKLTDCTYQAYTQTLSEAKTLVESTSNAACNKETLSSLTSAVESNGSLTESNTTAELVAAYSALQTAIDAVNASVEAYATAADVLAKMKAVTASTNFYTADALQTYYTQWKDKYDAGILTTDEANALQDPTVADYSARDSRGMAPKFLLSVWDDGGTVEDNAVTRGDYYINTWSTEGASDGSSMTVPFFEYWVSNASTLSAKELTAKLTGLTADQLYKVSALVRVHVTNDGTSGSGITLQVGDGTAVDVCGGTAASEAGYYYSTYTATGKADSEGNLTVKFIVAESNNISWLAFKNVNYEETSVDVSALSNAITTAESLNSTITNGVSSLASAIETAKALLTSTSQDDIDAGVTALQSAIETAKTVIAARVKANGYYKKYTALNKVIGNESQDEAIAALKTVYENADATADDVTTALSNVTLLDGYTKLDIANGTFDESTNFDQEGVNKGTMISPATEAKPYLWDVTGWTWNGTFGSTASHANTAYYGTTLENTNQGTNGTNPPAADMFGESDGQALHLSSGWGDIARYEQSVGEGEGETKTLVAGQYVFYYEAYNANTATSLNGNYCGVNGLTAVPSSATVTGNQSASISSEKGYVYENNKYFASGEWTANAMAFDLAQAETGANVSIGVVGASNGSGNGAKLWLDNVEVYYIPATMATYTRTATTSGYGTICLPYAAEGAENVTVYEIAGVNSTSAPTTIYLTEAESMEAGKPYIYYAGDGKTAADAVFTQTNTTTVESPVAGTNNLTGVFTSQAGSVANDSYILSGGKWYKVDNSSDFNLGDNRAYISTFEGMTEVSEASDVEVKAMSIDDETATAISGISKASAADGAIYTLSGQRVGNVSKGGLYIVNGKKVWMK